MSLINYFSKVGGNQVDLKLYVHVSVCVRARSNRYLNHFFYKCHLQNSYDALQMKENKLTLLLFKNQTTPHSITLTSLCLHFKMGGGGRE